MKRYNVPLQCTYSDKSDVFTQCIKSGKVQVDKIRFEISHQSLEVRGLRSH